MQLTPILSPAWAFPQGHGVSPWPGAAVKRDEGTQLTCTRSYKATIPATAAPTHSVEVTYPVQEECEPSFHHDQIIQGLIPRGIRMKWEKQGPSPSSACGFLFFPGSPCSDILVFSVFMKVFSLCISISERTNTRPRQTPLESRKNSTSGQFHLLLNSLISSLTLGILASH